MMRRLMAAVSPDHDATPLYQYPDSHFTTQCSYRIIGRINWYVVAKRYGQCGGIAGHNNDEVLLRAKMRLNVTGADTTQY